jgi:hypothetical protein
LSEKAEGVPTRLRSPSDAVRPVPAGEPTYEGGRFADVSGRMHATGGGEVRLFAFHLAGERPVSLSFAGDLAARYRNVGVSLGFWN